MLLIHLIIRFLKTAKMIVQFQNHAKDYATMRPVAFKRPIAQSIREPEYLLPLILINSVFILFTSLTRRYTYSAAAINSSSLGVSLENSSMTSFAVGLILSFSEESSTTEIKCSMGVSSIFKMPSLFNSRTAKSRSALYGHRNGSGFGRHPVFPRQDSCVVSLITQVSNQVDLTAFRA